MANNIRQQTYFELISGVMETLYASGPPVVKLCSIIDSGIYPFNFSVGTPLRDLAVAAYEDFGETITYPTDKILGTSTSTSYSVSPTSTVTFLGIEDFIGQDTGFAEMVEVWNSDETQCYFRFRLIGNSTQINGNNDIIRVVIEMTHGASQYNLVPYDIPEVVDTSPAIFPIQYRITFPAYLLRTDYHYPTEFDFIPKLPNGDFFFASNQINGPGSLTGISFDNVGWRGQFYDYLIHDGQNYPRRDAITFKFDWIDSRTAILTLDAVRSDTYMSKLCFEIGSSFYDDPLVSSLTDPSVLGPRTLVIERKRNVDLDFVPITVTEDKSVVTITGSRYRRISMSWTWDIK